MAARRAPGESLIEIVVPPTIWAAHFLACYVTAAVFCAKAGAGADLAGVEQTILVLTAAAAALIGVSGARAVIKGGLWAAASPDGADGLSDRRRFVAYATFLLAGLSLVSTLFVALPALLVETCR